MYKINVFHTHTEINDYELGSEPGLEKKLSVWDSSVFRFKPIGYSYDEDEKRLRIARGFPLHVLEQTFREPPNVVYTPDEYAEMSMRMRVKPRNDIQKDAIAFLLGEGKYMHTKKYAQMLLNLAPGAGKTYITAAAMSFFRMKSIIITHTNDIKEQWLDTFTEMTDLSEPHICVIRNSAVITRLMGKDTLPFKVYLVTHSTIASYAKRNGWGAVHELFKHLQIGLKVIDEAHLNFANSQKIDHYTNCKKNLYLTATFGRSDFYEHTLFKRCMANVVKYGEKQVQVDRKHILYLAILYNSWPSVGEEASMYTMRKFNRLRYAKYAMTCDKFFDALKYTLDYLSTKSGKILVLSSSIESCGVIRKFIEETYKGKVVRELHSKVSKEERDDTLSADIICSTSQSSGTGKDIPGLRAVINTEAYSSQVTADQVSGRLRQYSETENTFYIELIDRGFRHCYKMYERRLPVFKKKCLKVLTLEFDRK